MAAAIHCDGQDDELAAFLVTNIDEAETTGLCMADMLGFCLAFVQAVAPDMLAPPPEPKPRARKPRQSARTIEPAQPEAPGGAGE